MKTHHDKKHMLIKTLTNKGLIADRWGNYKFKIDNRTLRFKFKKRVVRLEELVPGSSGTWVRLSSVPFGKLTATRYDYLLKHSKLEAIK